MGMLYEYDGFAKADELKRFQDYCWAFYAPNEIHGYIFDQKLTREELDAACVIISLRPDFEGDSFDREKMREILRFVRDTKELARRAFT